jgi:hypothetical protein
LTTASPFGDAFDPEMLAVGRLLEHLLIWTNSGRRLDLQARYHG